MYPVGTYGQDLSESLEGQTYPGCELDRYSTVRQVWFYPIGCVVYPVDNLWITSAIPLRKTLI